jgi:DNA-binding response OmpR family regulator
MTTPGGLGVSVAKTVLIVEDERLLARTLSAALKEAGYGAVVVSGRKQAESEWLGSDAFDLVILDNRLSEGTGLELLESARENGRGSKVILMTAFDSRDVRSEAKRLKVDKYLRKPFDLDRIMKTVKELIGTPQNGGPVKPHKEGGD